MEWIKVSKKQPEELKEDQHLGKLYLNTKEYGCMTGFYYKGKYMANYALEILDVTHWMHLPKAPKQFFWLYAVGSSCIFIKNKRHEITLQLLPTEMFKRGLI